MTGDSITRILPLLEKVVGYPPAGSRAKTNLLPLEQLAAETLFESIWAYGPKKEILRVMWRQDMEGGDDLLLTLTKGWRGTFRKEGQQIFVTIDDPSAVKGIAGRLNRRFDRFPIADPPKEKQAVEEAPFSLADWLSHCRSAFKAGPGQYFYLTRPGGLILLVQADREADFTAALKSDGIDGEKLKPVEHAPSGRTFARFALKGDDAIVFEPLLTEMKIRKLSMKPK